MPWSDDFITELGTSTGLPWDTLVDVVQRANPAYADTIRNRDWQAAVERGRALLLAHLNDEQRASFEARQRFYVTGSEGQRFCIHLGREGNVWTVGADGQHVGGAMCVHIRDRVPDADNVLAQALMIETDQRAFLRLARR